MIFFILLITVAVISISMTEAISWAFTIAHHAKWLNAHRDYERRAAISGVSLFRIAILSCSLSIFSWVWFMHLIALFILDNNIFTYRFAFCFVLIFGIQIVIISMWTVISKFICLPGIFWPWVTSVRARFGLTMIKPSDTDTYCAALEEWREFYISIRKGKSLLINFLNTMPIIMWTQDYEGRFTYVSKYFYTVFGIDSYTSVIGKTGHEVTELVKFVDSSFQGINFNDDRPQLLSGEKKYVVELYDMIINEQVSYFQIIRVPMYREDRIVGTIGSALDKTWELTQLHEINHLFLNNRVTEGILRLEKFLNEIQESKGIFERLQSCTKGRTPD